MFVYLAIPGFLPSSAAGPEPIRVPSPKISKFDLTCDSCRVALLAQPELGTNIAFIQAKIKSSPNPAPFLEQLGWEYVKKARSQNDPGLYRMAEQCARCWETNFPGTWEPLLLKGHVFHSLHQFKEAESIANKLVSGRGSPFDYGLLGDACYDLGKVREAVEAYQKMMDLKPDAHAYLRAGQIRWIKGDLEGASEMYLRAVQASNAHDPEASAWMRSKLAAVFWQLADLDGANLMVDEAIKLDAQHAASLHLKGRLLLSEGKETNALVYLKQAADAYPLPEYLWTYADALRLAGKEKEAIAAEAVLLKKGASMDPRSYSLFLSTRRIKPEESESFARRELKERQDIFSHDALAFALYFAGKQEEARSEMELALAENTIDPRLVFHAALIFESSDQKKAAKLGKIAGQMQALLQPSEKNLLDAFNKKFISLTTAVNSVNTN
ncbi:MAG: tetratricopeptide repeat protein [Verrucomicrobiales bacterium]|nr:tetratricopeptide repeat protein [Verrucomicrobiales bacterium]